MAWRFVIHNQASEPYDEASIRNLFELKKPSESTGPWDYLKLLQTTPADEAFRPLADGGCPLVRS